MMKTVTTALVLAMLGASRAATAAALNGGQRSARRTEEDEQMSPDPVFCNSIGCPGGYIPIPSAWETECTGGICTVGECCDSFCWGFACTVGFPNYQTINQKCPNTGCTASLCCTIPVLQCNSIGCPAGFIPIPNAASTPCTSQNASGDTVCTTAQCCDAFCWGHPCSEPLIPDPNTINDECPLSGCSDSLCCTTVN